MRSLTAKDVEDKARVNSLHLSHAGTEKCQAVQSERRHIVEEEQITQGKSYYSKYLW